MLMILPRLRFLTEPPSFQQSPKGVLAWYPASLLLLNSCTILQTTFLLASPMRDATLVVLLTPKYCYRAAIDCG